MDVKGRREEVAQLRLEGGIAEVWCGRAQAERRDEEGEYQRAAGVNASAEGVYWDWCGESELYQAVLGLNMFFLKYGLQ